MTSQNIRELHRQLEAAIAEARVEALQHLPANLRGFREAQGMTSQEVAVACGLTRAQISHYETGKSVPTLAVACLLADALGVGLSELVAEGPAAEEAPEDGERA